MKVRGSINKYGKPFLEIRIRRSKLGLLKAGDDVSVDIKRNKIVLNKIEGTK